MRIRRFHGEERQGAAWPSVPAPGALAKPYPQAFYTQGAEQRSCPHAAGGGLLSSAVARIPLWGLVDIGLFLTCLFYLWRTCFSMDGLGTSLGSAGLNLALTVSLGVCVVLSAALEVLSTALRPPAMLPRRQSRR